MSDINTYLRLPFDKQFGELRSILSAGELDPSSAEQAWSVMFAMASVDRARFLSEVLGYIRGAGFFDRGFSAPMFRDRDALRAAYETTLGEDGVSWVDYSDWDDLRSEELYGVELTFEQAALLGCPEQMTAGCLWRDDFDDRVIIGIPAWTILRDDKPCAEKIKDANQQLAALLGDSLTLLGIDVKPSFYAWLSGYKVEASLIMGGMHMIEDSDGKWCSELDAKGLDAIRPHDYYSQDDELDGPAYMCAQLEYLAGQGISRFDLSRSAEARALKRLREAGIEHPTRCMSLFTHM